jgi:hypothetical protein
MRSRRCKVIQQIFWKHASPATSNWQKLYDVEVDFWSHWTLLISDFQISRMLRRAGGEKVKGTATFWCQTLQILHDAQVFFVSARSRYNELEKATSWTLPNASCLQLKPLVRVKYTLSTWVWAVSPSLYKHCCQTTKTTTSKEISLAVNYDPVTAPRFRSVIAVVISNACKKTSICSTR